MIDFLILIGFVFVSSSIVILLTLLLCPARHKREKAFILECFLQFVESSQLPKYDKWRGKLYRWVVWHVQHKKEISQYDERIGQKMKTDRQWYEIVCMSISHSQWLTLGHAEGICRSNHIFRLKFSDEEYAQILNETLTKKTVIQKLNECNMENYGYFYC